MYNRKRAYLAGLNGIRRGIWETSVFFIGSLRVFLWLALCCLTGQKHSSPSYKDSLKEQMVSGHTNSIIIFTHCSA